MIVKYPTVDFNVKCLMMDPVTLQWIVFLPDMCHLTKNIATSLKLSSSKNLKCNSMYGKVPVNMGMVKEIWLKCEGHPGNSKQQGSLFATSIKIPIPR